MKNNDFVGESLNLSLGKRYMRMEIKMNKYKNKVHMETGTAAVRSEAEKNYLLDFLKLMSLNNQDEIKTKKKKVVSKH